jgi:hypothetical protein
MSSWPGLTRPSISLFRLFSQAMDARGPRMYGGETKSTLSVNALNPPVGRFGDRRQKRENFGSQPASRSAQIFAQHPWFCARSEVGGEFWSQTNWRRGIRQLVRHLENRWRVTHKPTHYLVQTNSPGYSITSSARASSIGGMSSPSTLAVFRLITSSYFVGACTGRSAGFSPLRMRST